MAFWGRALHADYECSRLQCVLHVRETTREVHVFYPLYPNNVDSYVRQMCRKNTRN